MTNDWEEVGEELTHHRTVVRELRRRQRAIEVQLAQQGISAPPHLQTENETLSRQIQTHEDDIVRLQTLIATSSSAPQNIAPTTQLLIEHSEIIVKEPTTRIFATAKALLDYVGTRVHTAQVSIDDITWGLNEPSFTPIEDAAYETLLDAMRHVCRKGILYREIVSFHNRHDVERIESFLSMNTGSYNLKYYDFDPQTTPPLLQFIIIDAEEVVLGYYRWPILSPQKEIRIATKQAEIVRLFEDYYEVLWQGAKPLKLGAQVEVAAFQAIKQRVLE